MGLMGVMGVKFFEPPSSSFQGGRHISHQTSLLPVERENVTVLGARNRFALRLAPHRKYSVFAEVVIGDNGVKELRESANAYEVISHTNKEKYIIFNINL